MTEKRFRFYQDIYETIFIEDMQGENIRLANEEDMSVESGLKLVDLLNAQHDALIKKDELLSKTLKVNSNYEKCLKEIDDVLSKHNIHTLEKLDQVLTNERTW